MARDAILEGKATKAGRAIGVVVLIFATAGAAGSQEYPKVINLNSSDVLTASLPDEAWSLEISSPGFKVVFYKMLPEGRRYLLAKNSSSDVMLSVFLEKVKAGVKSAECREYLQNWPKTNPFTIQDLQSSVVGKVPIIEFITPEVQGHPVQMKNIVGCLAREGAFADIHVSKALFKPDEEVLLLSVIKAAHFREGTGTETASVTFSAPSGKATPPSNPKSSMDYFRLGGEYYLARQFDKAIGPFQKALDVEEENPQLDKNHWRVLVDGLGISYGITGDLTRAEETLEYGIAKDSTYPNFYYDMACVFAERSDLDQTMVYLKKAFEFKQNVVPGEELPDPRKDDSFQRFMKNPKFRRLLDQLTASPH